MPPRGQDPNATSFVAADVIGSEGIGQHGELLLDALAAAYPEELQAVLNYRENEDLTRELNLRGTDYDAMVESHEAIAKIADVEPERILRAIVRGGADENGRNRDPRQAWISYVALDDTGDNVFKGVYPFGDHGESSSDEHFAQLRAAAETPAGRRYLEARLKKREAEGDTPTAATVGDPLAALADAKASELVALMEQHPDKIDAVKAFEEATHGDNARKTVMEFEPESSPGDGGSDGEGSDAASEGGDGGGDDSPTS